MRAMGVAMMRLDGRRMDFLTAMVHTVLFWIINSVLTPLILLAGLFTERSRLVHDMLLGTVMIGEASPTVWQRLSGASSYLLAYLGIASGLGLVGSWLLARRVKRQTLGLEPQEIAGLAEHREAMLYGHLDFEIDPPGPVNRDLTYFYEVHVQCKAPNGAHAGNIEVRVEMDPPVLGEPGALESTLDFLLLPAQISRRIDGFIQSKLQSVPNTVIGGDPCRSIGVGLGQTALFDQMSFDPPPPPGRGVRADLADTLSDHARVEFLSITRRPLPSFVAPEFADPGNPAAGYFTVWLNGAIVGIPPPPGAPDGLLLPPAGGTVALNDCRTISLGGSDRLQVLFVNGLGGSVWSQFPRGAGFGADLPRRMTTGRGIVLPARPPSNKPSPMTLGEFELLYRIVYLPAPAVSVESAAGSTTSPVSPLHDVHGTATVLSDGSPPPTPCREI